MARVRASVSLVQSPRTDSALSAFRRCDERNARSVSYGRSVTAGEMSLAVLVVQNLDGVAPSFVAGEVFLNQWRFPDISRYRRNRWLEF